MLPPKHPDSLDTGISGGWDLTSNQPNRLSDTGLSGDPNSSFLSPDSEESERREYLGGDRDPVEQRDMLMVAWGC